MNKKEMLKKIEELECQVENLKVLNHNLRNNFQKAEKGECVITDHCNNCKHASIITGFYPWSTQNGNLVTCDLFHFCPHYERKGEEYNED